MVKILKTEDTQLLAKLNHDVQEIHNVIEPDIFKAYSEDNMKKLFVEALADKDVSAYIAYADEVPAGYILLCKAHFAENFFKKSYSVLFIEQICVEAQYKGKGIGKALVDFSKEFARDNNINRIEMDYWTKNNNSGEFFRSQGFAAFNERMYINL